MYVYLNESLILSIVNNVRDICCNVYQFRGVGGWMDHFHLDVGSLSESWSLLSNEGELGCLVSYWLFSDLSTWLFCWKVCFSHNIVCFLGAVKRSFFIIEASGNEIKCFPGCRLFNPLSINIPMPPQLFSYFTWLSVPGQAQGLCSCQKLLCAEWSRV